MRVLHFEYSDFFRRIVHDMSVRQGVDYVESNAGGDLFKLLSKYDIDVILTGMELADMSVETLLQDLEESKFQKTPVVILTSSDVDDISKRLKNLKFTDFILKEDLSPTRLKNTLSRISHLIEQMT